MAPSIAGAYHGQARRLCCTYMLVSDTRWEMSAADRSGGWKDVILPDMADFPLSV